MLINASWATDQGKVRFENQDALLCNRGFQFYAVSDGMGGLPFGKQTAQMVAAFLEIHLQCADLPSMTVPEQCACIKNAIQEVSTSIQKMGNSDYGVARYGATLTGFHVTEDAAIVFNVGDSRVYILRENETLKQITKDDNLYEMMLASEDGIPEMADIAMLQNQLTQYMGMYPVIAPAVSIEKLHEGDMLLACSDGLTKMLPDEEIQEILRSGQDTEKCAAELIHCANDAGGRDNISVIVLKVRELP